jgi:hypothetical protein
VEKILPLFDRAKIVVPRRGWCQQWLGQLDQASAGGKRNRGFGRGTCRGPFQSTEGSMHPNSSLAIAMGHDDGTHDLTVEDVDCLHHNGEIMPSVAKPSHVGILYSIENSKTS